MSKRTANPISVQHTTMNNTMKTKTRKNHPLDAYGADTNKVMRYEITVRRTDCLYTTFEVAADSQREAQEVATEIAKSRPEGKWHLADRDLLILETSELTQGGRYV